MKKRLRIYRWPILLIALCLVIYSCSKTEITDTERAQLSDPNTMLDVEGARAYFKDLVTQPESNNSGIQSLSTSVKAANKKYILFSKAFVGVTSKASFVEAPMLYGQRSSFVFNYGRHLTTEQQLAVFKGTLSRLLIYKSKISATLNQKILTYIPDIEYLKKHNYDISSNRIDKLDADFSGCIQYSKWDGTPLSMLVFNNGKFVKRISLNRISVKGTGNQMTQSISGKTKTDGQYLCDYEVVPVFIDGCITAGEGVNAYTTCIPIYDHDEWIPLYCDDGLSGDPCADYGIGCPGDPTPDPGTGGTGTSTGATFNPQGIDLPPCMAAILNSLKASSYQIAAIANIFNDPINVPDCYGVGSILNTVMNNPNYPIAFSVGNSSPDANAYTDASALNPATIELQSPFIDKATELAVVRVMIHESIHAYFQYGLSNFQGDPNFANFQATNDVLFDTNSNPQSDQNLAQHNQMALDYVNGIASMLEIYANNNGITSPDPNRSMSAYCRDLAWAGLFGTNAYKSLPLLDQDRIYNTGLNEQDKKQGSTPKKACP